MAGASFPYYIGYHAPFELEYIVTPIVMSLIGGTASWVGPLVGVVLLCPQCKRSKVWSAADGGRRESLQLITPNLPNLPNPA
jgi:ABC-type branched-subunit amino acid transport system permease subunit